MICKTCTPEIREFDSAVNGYIQSEPPSLYHILQCVCNFLEVNITEVLTRDRARPLVEARQISMYIAIDYYDHYEQADFFFRDRSTIYHAIDTVQDLMDTDEDFRNKVERARRCL